MTIQSHLCFDALVRWTVIFFTVLSATTSAAIVKRLPMQRKTSLCNAESPSAVILVPHGPDYRRLGEQLANAIAEKTSVQLEVKEAKYYISKMPRTVKPGQLDKHFILLGQFWNNAVLERLYAGYFDPTDALFPGPGGYELRTVCSPFRHGHNCIVATGSDLEGCRKAIAELPKLIRRSGAESYIPFLHRVHLAGEAADIEADYRRRADPILAQLDRYAVFGHPQPKMWTSENPLDFLVWKDRNLDAAAGFGLRFWVTSDRRDAEAFKRLVFGCLKYFDRLTQAYREGRTDLIEYSLPALTIAWDMIEETDAFTDIERQKITDYLFQLAEICRNQYFVYRCKDLALPDVKFYNRHQISGTIWMGLEADYLTRNCNLTDEQKKLRDDWQAHAQHYLQRLVQSYFYGDGTALINDEGELVLRYALKTGNMDFVNNGSLRLLADYWVANHDNIGYMASSGQCGNTRHGPVGGEVLNAAGYLFPGEGYRWYRSRLGRWPYASFLFRMLRWAGLGFPYYNWEMPPADDGSEKLRKRMTGVCVLPIGKAFDDYLRRYPDMWQGGYQRVPGRYHYDPVPYEKSFKRIILRSGFEKDDQYFVLDGMQGIEWSYDDVGAIVRYCDLGQPLLKSQWDARNVESRLEMNTLFVSNGTPGAKQSIAARLLTAADLGRQAMLSILAAHHDGVSWTRHVFWQKRAWFLIADEVQPYKDGDYFLAQTWLSWYPFKIEGMRATADAKGVTLNIVGTPERQFSLAEGGEGVRQKVFARLTRQKPYVLWTLLYANNADRPAFWNMRRVAYNAVLLTSADGESETDGAVLAFLGKLNMGGMNLIAEMGLISAGSLTVAGCRELSIDGQRLISSSSGLMFSWDMMTNTFKSGKVGFGLQSVTRKPNLREHHNIVATAVQKCLDHAVRQIPFSSPPITTAGAVKFTPLPIAKHMKLLMPISLAAADIDGDGEDELLLYDKDGKQRFKYPAFCDAPVAVDFDGNGKRAIAFALGKKIVVYNYDGTLRWQRELTNTTNCLSVGDLNGDGREELGLSQWNWASVLDYEGRRLIDEEVYRYDSIASAFGDVDGDGEVEFVDVTCSGINVLEPGQSRRTVSWQSFFGVSPCRIWLRDFDGDGVLECYVGGMGTDPACYDLRAMRCRWRFNSAAIHPRDVAVCDLDGDGKPELISGGGDSFLYVIGHDGKFRFSRSVGAGITALATVPRRIGKSDALAVGLETGQLLLMGRDLRTLGIANIGEPVLHLAVLQHDGGNPVIIAAGGSGQAVCIATPLSATVPVPR